MGKVDKKIKSPKEKSNNKVVSAQLKKQIKARTVKRLNDKKPERGIVFIKHLPSEFREPELRTYFRQFGKVLRIKLARSERTGNSKRYAYVEFEVPEVAQIAAASMNNYLMFKKLVKTSYIPPAEQKFNYFRRNVRFVRYHGKLVPVSKITRRQNESVKKNNSWTVSDYQKRTNKSLEKINKLKSKYAALGINLDDIVLKPAAPLLEQSLSIEKTNLDKPKTAKSDKTQSDDSKKKKLIQEKLNLKKEKTEVKSKNLKEKSDKIKKPETVKPTRTTKPQNKKVAGKADTKIKNKPKSKISS